MQVFKQAARDEALWRAQEKRHAAMLKELVSIIQRLTELHNQACASNAAASLVGMCERAAYVEDAKRLADAEFSAEATRATNPDKPKP